MLYRGYCKWRDGKVFDDCSQYRGIWYIYRIYGRNVFQSGSDNKQIQERTVDAKGEEIDNLANSEGVIIDSMHKMLHQK